MKRFSAKLLFCYRTVQPSTCQVNEERIITFAAESGDIALAYAKERGQTAQYRFTNDANEPVDFHFIGIRDMIHLGNEAEEDEVWYEVKERETDGGELVRDDTELLIRLQH